MNQLRIVVMEEGPLQEQDHDATLRQLGLIDPRTGLPHRDLLLDRLGQAAAAVSRGGAAFALMCIGVAVPPGPPGPGRGEPAEALRDEFAHQLLAMSRHTDSFAVSGPDEFLALIPGNPSVAGLMAMGQKIAAGFAGRLQVHIGVALCPRHAADAGVLLQQACAALEQARSAQVITALYEPRGLGTATRCEPPSTGEDDLSAPGFVPVIDLKEGGLLRLQIVTGLSGGGTDFAPTAIGAGPRGDRCAQLRRLLRMLDRALEAASGWRRQGLPVRLSLPLPGRLLDEPTLAPALLALLDRHRWPAPDLTVEARSAAIMQRGAEVIEALSAAGVPLSIDDEGDGLALHLAMAAPAAVAELKFDAGALGLLRSEAQRAAVVRALVALAQGWQARVVATGVDDLVTRAWLAELGCDAAHGQACGRELPADQVPAWCAGRRGEAGPAAQAGARAPAGSRLGRGQSGAAALPERSRPH
ncbi:EAL domain-containing protein [Sphaerotilus uruguayifluvii]|uniref:EAL domain-containing protein (Putative c-di-GMP-specific phosphodiesterase class I)/GGDEF domain-containing protein n=1 Tax=Sphaerotilus uruguayifluvii TaxID=2735897 RepID=A0ABX2G1N7_9BURK|nr:EAL domain-containing protein [Leptothrix sp. C29]NRT55329.1 EAL domain-containing protein (putative c-di-GMP-specific phosphodiesterase class I)/GGDEF domain-containing protein [Leptothrix sp. C29]